MGATFFLIFVALLSGVATLGTVGFLDFIGEVLGLGCFTTFDAASFVDFDVTLALTGLSWSIGFSITALAFFDLIELLAVSTAEAGGSSGADRTLFLKPTSLVLPTTFLVFGLLFRTEAAPLVFPLFAAEVSRLTVFF